MKSKEELGYDPERAVTLLKERAAEAIEARAIANAFSTVSDEYERRAENAEREETTLRQRLRNDGVLDG